MTIAQALKKYPKIETELLLAHILQKSKEFLYAEPGKNLTPSQQKQFAKLIKKRAAGMPIAYLLGYKYFYGLKFLVNKHVLIPRPESEWLVDRALKLAGRDSKILDVGTGSGCIAISISKYAGALGAHVWASDISQKALRVAEENARALKAKVQFCHSNLLEKVPTQFDVIIANLPYVPIRDYETLRPNLKYEPQLALTDGTNRFMVIDKLISQAKSKLRNNGVLLLEIDPAAKDIVAKSARRYLPAKKVRFYKDLNNLVRFAEIT
jgi:release factor glutamine methyltransferase